MRTYAPVVIDIDKVRASGIVKDQIDLDEPDESGTFSATLLRAAIATTLDFERRWAKYAESEHEPLVLPVLVVQVADKPTDNQLSQLVSIIEDSWPGLEPHAIVNVFGEHEDLVTGSRTLRWVRPESIEGETGIRVVLAKQAISTGWDCPRAEVLYSERAARDATNIAQVIGRMVRSPLARRIPTDATLNSVTCFLPHFDRAALGRITEELTKPGEVGEATEVVVNAQLFERNAEVPAEVFELVEALPSWPAPDALANPLRRAKSLAKLLTDDEAPGGPLMADAGEQLTKALNLRLDGLAAEHAEEIAANVKNLQSAEIHRTSISTTGEAIETSTRSETTAIMDIDRDTRKLVASVKEGVAKDYLRYKVEATGDNADVGGLRMEVAALVMVKGVAAEIEAAAVKWVQGCLTQFRVDIENTTGATKDAYRKVKEQASVPEEVPIELTTTLKAPTTDKAGADLPTFGSHLYADGNGEFPGKFNDWEAKAVKAELDRPSFVAWYRNPPRPMPSCLRIAYQKDGGHWGSLQVDFLVISRRNDGTLGVSIVDPHGDHLADAKAKLRGLADYAERFGGRYVRIESICKTTSGQLRNLNLKDAEVRQAVRDFEGGKVTPLYESTVANDFV